MTETVEVESPPVDSKADIKADVPDKAFSIAEFFKSTVTVPRDTITVYTDGEAAWEYEKIKDRQTEIIKEMTSVQARIDAINGQAAPANPRSIAEEPMLSPGDRITAEIDALEDEHESLQASKGSVLSRLKASGVVFGMRALLPAEISLIDGKAARIVAAQDKEKETQPEDQVQSRREDVGTALVLEGMVEYIVYPGNKRVTGPFKWHEFLAMKESLDQAEYGRLIGLANALNTKQAFKDAQADAGFHS